jgi:signal transduction histidine kinase
MSLDYGSEEHEYTSEDIALSKAIGRLAALVIERERLLHERAEARARELALGEANLRMDEFLGVASHELRTPLTSIKGNVQLAKRQLRKFVQSRGPFETDASRPSSIDRLNIEAEITTHLEAAQGLLDRTERQIQLLNRLVGDLLDVSRIQANKLELRLEHCDLVGIVREAVEDQQQIAPLRLIRLELPPEKVYVIADSGAIGQVVTNYLSNALKYSASDRLVEVTLSIEGQAARLSVHDDGPGLPDSEQERVWERFYRVSGIEVQSGSQEGLGLGLHISRTIIERHQGQVGIQSSPGHGSTFWFTLPLAHTPNL